MLNCESLNYNNAFSVVFAILLELNATSNFKNMLNNLIQYFGLVCIFKLKHVD